MEKQAKEYDNKLSIWFSFYSLFDLTQKWQLTNWKIKPQITLNQHLSLNLEFLVNLFLNEICEIFVKHDLKSNNN